MGLFSPKKRAKSKPVVVRVQTTALDAEMKLWQAKKNDVKYQRLLAENNSLHEEISSEYAIIRNLNLYQSPQADQFEQKCIQAIALIEMLFPFWEKYREPLPTYCEPAKRLAMLYEKQNRFEDAAFICVKACRLGMPNDGTKGGMRGRLSSSIKKGGLTPNSEMKSILGL